MSDMDLSSYTGLKAAIADYLDRQDLTTQIPGFIQLNEALIRRRVRRKTLRSQVTFNAETFQIPSDCAELRSLRLVTADRRRDVPIQIVTPEILSEHRAARGATGRPIFAAVVGNTLLLVPAPAAATAAELTYFEKLVPLSATNLSNSVLAEAPDLYLYGACLQAAPFLQHDERIPVWEAFVEKAITQLEAQRQSEESGASLRPSRLPTVFG